jgi:hypothetical protein
MENLSNATLLELFGKRLAVLHASMEKLDKLRAPLERPAGLLRLPFELRLQIYHYCIPQKRVIDVHSPCFPIEWPYEQSDHTLDRRNSPNFSDDGLENPVGDIILDLEDGWWDHKNSIFLLSKQISGEALDVLYGDNIFKLHLHGRGEYFLEKNFAEGNRKRMRYLLLIAQPRGVSYTPERVPDDKLWCSILPQLKVLRIVAEQPLEAGSYYNAPTLQQGMDRWVNWIRPFLKCFGQHLLRQTIVEVDYDNRVETEAIVKESLPCSYRQIRCRHDGDLIFKRGQFSLESGYWDDDGPVSSRDADGDWGLINR